MIHLIVLFFASVLVDDHGHETMGTFGYIITGIAALIWLHMTITATHDASDPER